MPTARTSRLLLCGAACALLLQAPASAQYQWKDARGQLHASDQPPPREIPDKDILKRPAASRTAGSPATVPATVPATAARPAASASPLAAASAPVDPELQQRKARAEQDAKARAQADAQRLAEQRAQNCQRARQHLATLDSGVRLVRHDERGERVVVDDAQRSREAAQARSVIASDCR